MRDRHPERACGALRRHPTQGRDRDCRWTATRGRSGQRRRARRRTRSGTRPLVTVARRRRGRGEAQAAAEARLRPRARTLKMNRQAAEQRGRGAETLACWYLRLHGWRILARRARVKGGEVDIVARRGSVVAFVEVKARADERSAAFALDDWRLRRGGGGGPDPPPPPIR